MCIIFFFLLQETHLHESFLRRTPIADNTAVGLRGAQVFIDAYRRRNAFGVHYINS